MRTVAGTAVEGSDASGEGGGTVSVGGCVGNAGVLGDAGRRMSRPAADVSCGSDLRDTADGVINCVILARLIFDKAISW